MTFNVQNIVASLNKSGVAKASHFEVQITGVGESDLERDMMFRCDIAELWQNYHNSGTQSLWLPIQKIWHTCK